MRHGRNLTILSSLDELIKEIGNIYLFMNLGSDGFVENIFHLLWTKEAMEKSEVPIYLPDTVVFKFKQPICWYFTSKNGKILKKSKRKLTIQTIEE